MWNDLLRMDSLLLMQAIALGRPMILDADALNLVAELKPECAYFTHISHRLGFHDEVQKILPENVFLSYDGLVVEV